jgi:subtilase family serine protease
MLRTASLAVLAAGLAQAAHYTPEAAKLWVNGGRAAMTDRKTFTVGMVMRDFPALERTLLDISNPFSANYGKWLSKEQADALTATPDAIAEEVRAWATSTGAECVRAPEAWRCEGSVAAIEMLLDAKLDYWVHVSTRERLIRTSMDVPGSVPASLEGKVTVVTGLTQFPLGWRTGSSRPMTLSDTDYSIVPESLRTIYNHTLTGSKATSVGPAEFQSYPAIIETDLTAFAKDMGLPAWTIPKNQTIGPFQPGAGAESALDEQYVYAMAPGVSQWYWTEADWQYEFATTVSTAAKTPAVFSISYAWYENDQCDISPSVAPCTGKPVPEGSAAFVAAVNQLYAKIGARGITLISASGDSGAHGRTDPGCTDPHTRPDYPACSPYVTSVGATELSGGKTGPTKTPICQSTLQCAVGGTEVVASNKLLALFSSGGGFSTQAPRPSWQDAVVAAYLKSGAMLPPLTDFNATNRGFPDVAALGHNYAVEVGGSINSVDGTSAATPVFSGIIADINAERVAAGKPVVGFVSPLLYGIYATDPLAFNDVTSGDNSCTEGACPCPAKTGFGATKGWDATTGLGTPNVGRMLAAMDAMGI